ncbi:hypothetical protein M0805_000886 [Coniferiporia weirii]|nr:hypothetical protein M0805_000886 [Coniferiporia weirii]
MNAQGNLGRPWTPYEDKLLTDAVRIYGENTEKWKTIALSVPGRTNKACRKRWLHSLSPTIKKCAWTPEEDSLLLSLFGKHPNKWSLIAREIPGRTDDACSKRYREALDPNLKKDEWTEEEDRRLLEVLPRFGGPAKPKWVLIGQELRRSGLGCRNRWRLLERKKKTVVRQTSQPDNNCADIVPHFLGDVSPLFAEDGPSTYWDPSWDPSPLVDPGVGAPEEMGLDIMTLNMDQFQMHCASSADTISVLDNARPVMAEVNSGTQTVLTIARASFSLDAALPDVRPRVRSSHTEDDIVTRPDGQEQTSYYPVSSGETNAEVYQTQSNEQTVQGADMYAFQSHHNVDFYRPRVEDIVPFEHSPDNQSVDRVDEQVSSSACVDLCRHGPDDNTGLPSGPATSNAPYLIPSANVSPPSIPQPQQEVQDHLPPPRKRRRAPDSSASSGIRIFSVQDEKQKTVPKLSSTLPITGDLSILAYACGHTSCWPRGTTSSSQCFATSGGLQNHFKDRHMDAPGACDETPFRCSLEGCGKGWKSINGLQYHLQISKVHYQRTFSVAATAKKKRIKKTITPEEASADHAPLEEELPSKPTRKLHKCPYSDCSNEYKQLSGLRYHLLHGHPKNLPAQLDSVPPTIARRLGVVAETPYLTS